MNGNLNSTSDLPAPFDTVWAGSPLKLWDVDWYGPRGEGTALVKAPDSRGACALCATFAEYPGALDLTNAGTLRDGRPFSKYTGGGFTFVARWVYG